MKSKNRLRNLQDDLVFRWVWAENPKEVDFYRECLNLVDDIADLLTYAGNAPTVVDDQVRDLEEGWR